MDKAPTTSAEAKAKAAANALTNTKRPWAKRWLLVAGTALLLAIIIAAITLALSGGDAASPDNSQTSGNSTGAASPTPGNNSRNPAADSAQGQAPANNNGSPGTNQPASNSDGIRPGTPASAINTNPSAASTIAITGSGFSPASLTVAINTVVTWRNQDSRDHAIDAAEDAPADDPHSPLLTPGNSYSYSYARPGTYKYISVLHPELSGTVVVKE